MAVIIKNLANGNITTVATDTKNPTTGKAWIVKNIILTNLNSAACNVTVKAIGKGIAPPSMVIPGTSTVFLDHELTLRNPTGTAEALTIQLHAALSPGLDYVINGVERDV